MRFDTVLVANRGEIALRVMRACKELGLRTVAVYSEADRDAPHVAYADDAFLIGPPPAAQSYLHGEAIIAAAQRANAGAIHPGYGFLSENAAFARACTAAGLVFVGPPPEAMERMGGKTNARREAVAAGVPVVPGTLEAVETPERVRELAVEYGYPVAIKAVGGGGGRGLRVVNNDSEVVAAFESARREAESAFKLPQLYVEKYLTDPRHIEIQILADGHGQVVSLGERDCSVQRRHQKLIEECPSMVLSAELRAKMGADAVALAQAVGYSGAGTLEFLFQDGQYYFLEMNTRIQVEHTVTEMVTGIDLVQAQLRVAQGEPLWFRQADVVWRGHAIECRINAEDPAAGFRPALGMLGAYHEPAGFGVRVDSAVRPGYTIPQYYDSLVAKLVAWGATRSEAIGRMRRALADYQLQGVRTTIPFHQLALAHPAFAAGDVTVNFIPRYLGEQLQHLAAPPATETPDQPDAEAPRMFLVEVNGKRFDVRVAETSTNGQAATPGATRGAAARARPAAPQRRSATTAPTTDGVMSSIQGTVVAASAQPGQVVEAGQVLFIIEAMKMENEITAPHNGQIGEVRVQVGQAVDAGAVLATYKTPA